MVWMCFSRLRASGSRCTMPRRRCLVARKSSALVRCRLASSNQDFLLYPVRLSDSLISCSGGVVIEVAKSKKYEAPHPAASYLCSDFRRTSMALKNLTTSALRAELARRERGAGKLAAKHKKLAARLAEIESELANLGVNGGGRRGRRPGRPAGRRGPGRPIGRRGRGSNAMSLPAMLAQAVRVGSTVSPADAAVAVKRAGYKSGSKTFGVQVAMALAKSTVFKRTGRGQYLRKPGLLGPPAKGGPKPRM